MNNEIYEFPNTKINETMNSLLEYSAGKRDATTELDFLNYTKMKIEGYARIITSLKKMHYLEDNLEYLSKLQKTENLSNTLLKYVNIVLVFVNNDNSNSNLQNIYCNQRHK